MQLPAAGGSYRRDPITGDLTQVEAPTKTIEPAPAPTQTAEQSADEE